MFWRRFEQSIQAAEAQEELRTFITERLRVAMEFATLGAYELLPQEPAPDPDSEPHSEPAETAAPRCHSPRSEPRSHVGSSNVPCAKPGEDRAETVCAWQRREREGALVDRRPRRGRGSERRGGSVRAAKQPCTWAGR
jgi:hypothetical protein